MSPPQPSDDAGRAKTRPILLVADQPIDAGGGGAVILHSLLDGRLGRDICWASPNHAEDDPKIGKYALRRRASGETQSGSWLSDFVVHRGRLSADVARLASSLDAAAVWFVMHGISVSLAADFLRHGRLPVHLSVHDDPVFATAIRSRKMFALTPWIARDFAYALRHARSVDVICPGMAERYSRKFGVSSVILHRALSEPVVPNSMIESATPSASGALTMGMLGNTYAYGQLPVMAEALLGAAKRLNVPARIVCCGSGNGERLRREFVGRLEVEVLGHIPESPAIERLRTCTMLYLNYPFSRWCRVLRETSFPTKLSTYLYAARPLLIHAPEHTSLESLDEEPDFVGDWKSIDPRQGEEVIVDLARRSEAGTDFQAPAERCRRRYFDHDRQHATLARILSELTAAETVSK